MVLALLKKLLSNVPANLRLAALAVLVNVVLANVVDAVATNQQKMSPQNVVEEILSMLSQHTSLASSLLVFVLVLSTQSLAKAL